MFKFLKRIFIRKYNEISGQQYLYKNKYAHLKLAEDYPVPQYDEEGYLISPTFKIVGDGVVSSDPARIMQTRNFQRDMELSKELMKRDSYE